MSSKPVRNTSTTAEQAEYMQVLLSAIEDLPCRTNCFPLSLPSQVWRLHQQVERKDWWVYMPE